MEQSEITNMYALINNAQRTADQALSGITSHERVCAERYDNIKDRLAGIPRLFSLLETNKTELSDDIKYLAKWVYMGVGIAVSLTTILELLRFFKG